jgi:hypothetical protein
MNRMFIDILFSLIKNNGAIVFELNIIINKELSSLFLSFGKDLIVLKPNKLCL